MELGMPNVKASMVVLLNNDLNESQIVQSNQPGGGWGVGGGGGGGGGGVGGGGGGGGGQNGTQCAVLTQGEHKAQSA